MAKAKTIAEAVNLIIEDDWREWITFDESKAKITEEVILVWKVTRVPIPMNITLTQKTFEDQRINFRELRGKIKNQLPSQIIKDRITEINSILRDANRRVLKDVAKDFNLWIKETGEILNKVLGEDIARDFLAPFSTPKTLKEGSIQAIQCGIEERIDRLYKI